jgi:hypothetical protein
MTSPAPLAARSPAEPRTGQGWLAYGAALLGALAYALHGWTQMHAQASVLDEGLYLYKGLLFVSGRYWPFQDMGPLTNHMPLAFYLPGWAQLLMGPGLRSGRLFALAVSLLMLMGVWLVSRRLGGRWWAAGAVWFVALNPMLVKIYSQALSEGLTAALLAWVLVFGLGPRRPLWQLLISSVLAAATLMVRINMLPLLPLLLAYIFWENGRRAGIWATLGGVGAFALGQAVFWPGVLKLWGKWLPNGLTPFLNHWRESADALPNWDPQIGPSGRWASLWFAIQRHWLSLFGVIVVWLAVPSRPAISEKRSAFRSAVFLTCLFLALLAMHLWATLGLNYCVFCLQIYLAFFSQLGIYLLILAGAQWFPRLTRRRQTFLAALLVTILLLLLLYYARSMVPTILESFAPRVQGMRLLEGSVPLWVFVGNKLGLARAESTADLTLLLRSWVGLLLVVLLLAILLGAVRRGGRSLPVGLRLLLVGAAFGTVLLSTFVAGNQFADYDCGGDVLASYERAGQDLAAKIPAKALIYWAGGLSPAPLLYLPQAAIFPPQLNDGYSFRLGGAPDDLLRFGLWNQALAEQWLSKADYVLVEERGYGGWLASQLRPEAYDEIQRTPPVVSCRKDSAILIFRRLP